MDELRLSVPGMTCAHCVTAVADELDDGEGVEDVVIDLATKAVVVTGTDLDPDAIWAAVDEAGYEVVV